MKRSLLAISVALGIAQGFFLLHWFDRYNQSNLDAMAFESNRVEIARLDEVLTMSARIHAATGEAVWQDRYIEHVEPLGIVLRETIDLAGSERARIAISSVSDANDRLVAMEEQSLALAKKGALNEAFALLTSSNYQLEKLHYQRGLEEALAISQNSIRKDVDYHRSVLILGVIVIFVSLLILTELWRRLSLLEQREAAQKMSGALEHERRLGALQRQFASMVSHEFRTPLAIIDGTMQRLERQGGPLTQERIQNASRKIRSTIDRLTGIMESVLNLTHLEDGHVNAVIELLDLARLISEVVAGYRNMYPNRSITLALDNTPNNVGGDSKLLAQVFSNIIANALKYSEKESPVHIEVYLEESEVAVAIHDRGRGIPSDEIDKIGQRFFRGASSDGIIGSGIGLRVATKVIELHGGRLEIQSQLNVGSTFIVRLPQNLSHKRQDVVHADRAGNAVPMTT